MGSTKAMAERQQAPQLGHEQSSDQWVPLASAKSMKDAIHNSFQMLIENPKLNEGIGDGTDAPKIGLNIYLRVIPKRRSFSAGDGTTQQKNARVINQKPITLGIVDVGPGSDRERLSLRSRSRNSY